MAHEPDNKVTLRVEGMSCGHCVNRVRKALDAAPGVIEAVVDLETGTAQIRHSAATDSAKLAAIVATAGYPPHAA